MNGAGACDLEQTIALFLGQFLSEAQRYGHLRAYITARLASVHLHIDLYLARVPFLSSGIHLQGDGDTGCQGAQKKLVWLGSIVLPAVVQWLISQHRVLSSNDPSGVWYAVQMGTYRAFHDLGI